MTSIFTGTRLGPYEILAPLGAGGMGEVYRARDTKLSRDVAIKILPQGFADDTERLSRFKREAQVLASLNHPSIAAIYGLEESDGIYALVLELVEGPTLADRIAGGPVSLDETLPIARQIAEGLEYAHERGIIHRDLKPANVKVTPDGAVKVLDFGLAKVFADDAQSADLSQSPTLSKGTQAGVILGTAAYMSPEQARGKPVDKRTDIWAFGCVLYEMITGRRPFEGETVTDILAAIVKQEPDWNALPAATPAAIRRLLRRCLRKDPRERLHSIADARIEINDVLSEPESGPLPQARWILSRKPFLLVPAALTAGVLMGVLLMSWRPWSPASHDAQSQLASASRATLNVPSERSLADIDSPPLAVSPDGRRFVLALDLKHGLRQLYLRSLDEFEVSPIAGTEDAELPFFSPDGQWVGFWSHGTLQKVAVRGGAPVRICNTAVIPRGASWGTDDTIILGGMNTGLFRVSAGGGVPVPLTTKNDQRGEQYHGWPDVLPDGRNVLVTINASTRSDIGMLSLETGKLRILEGTEGGAQPKYLESGHLVYARGGSLFGVRFDPSKSQQASSAAPGLSGVHTRFHAGLNLTDFAVSRTGLLLYAPGAAFKSATQLLFFDRKGEPTLLPMEAGNYYSGPRLSQDGDRMVFNYNRHFGSSDVWVQDLRRDTRTRVTIDAPNIWPLWTPDGSRLTFAAWRSGSFNLYWKRADGSGEAEPLLIREHGQFPASWSKNGRELAFVELNPDTREDIWILHRDSKPDTTRLLATPFSEKAPAFSPDGDWLAYQSDESGRYEVYVQPYPGPGSRSVISKDGGEEPVWSPNGKELFYRNGDSLIVVSIETTPTFRCGSPRVLFEANFIGRNSYDVTPDGKQIVAFSRKRESLVQLNVVLNWSAELERLVPKNPHPLQ